MNSPYTTTITDEAIRRGIHIETLDSTLPIFELKLGDRAVRCYNALTDRVGAATFHLAQDKRAMNKFLKAQGFPVPAQIAPNSLSEAVDFLRIHASVVVKPAREWGGRGVSVDIRSESDLQWAMKTARKFSDDILVEECVTGLDYRLIIVDGVFVAAIERTPASITGNGKDSIIRLIRKQNAREQRKDKSHRIPVDRETMRALKSANMNWRSIPSPGQSVFVRRTTNYHTGGSVRIITDSVSPELAFEAKRVADVLSVPVLGVDFFVDLQAGRHWIIECSPDMAISPPEGGIVAVAFLDYLFPETRRPSATQ